MSDAVPTARNGGHRWRLQASLSPLGGREAVDQIGHLLSELAGEACAHTWRRHLHQPGLDPALMGRRVLEAERQARPTELFAYRAIVGGATHVVATAVVAERLRSDFELDGLPVLGRCYIHPAFRGRGFYQQILNHRLDYCVQRWGDRLRGVHLGSASARILRRACSLDRAELTPFVSLGLERLALATQVWPVHAMFSFSTLWLEALLGELDFDAELQRRVADLARGRRAEAHLEPIRARLYDIEASGGDIRSLAPRLNTLITFADSIPVIR